VLLKLLNFYSDFFVEAHILSQKFELVRRSDDAGPMESVAIERLKLWQKEFNEEIWAVVRLLKIDILLLKIRKLAQKPETFMM